jgi:hypothetical protein
VDPVLKGPTLLAIPRSIEAFGRFGDSLPDKKSSLLMYYLDDAAVLAEGLKGPLLDSSC